MSVVKRFASPSIDVLTVYSACEALLRWCSHDEVVRRVSFDSTWRARDAAPFGGRLRQTLTGCVV